MEVPVATSSYGRILPSLHHVDQPGDGHIQAARFQGRVTTVGQAEEQAGHELRNDGQGAEVCSLFNERVLLMTT